MVWPRNAVLGLLGDFEEQLRESGEGGRTDEERTSSHPGQPLKRPIVREDKHMTGEETAC